LEGWSEKRERKRSPRKKQPRNGGGKEWSKGKSKGGHHGGIKSHRQEGGEKGNVKNAGKKNKRRENGAVHE